MFSSRPRSRSPGCSRRRCSPASTLRRVYSLPDQLSRRIASARGAPDPPSPRRGMRQAPRAGRGRARPCPEPDLLYAFHPPRRNTRTARPGGLCLARSATATSCRHRSSCGARRPAITITDIHRSMTRIVAACCTVSIGPPPRCISRGFSRRFFLFLFFFLSSSLPAGRRFSCACFRASSPSFPLPCVFCLERARRPIPARLEFRRRHLARSDPAQIAVRDQPDVTRPA